VSGVSRQWGSKSPAGGAAAQGGSPCGGKAQLGVGHRARRGIQGIILFKNSIFYSSKCFTLTSQIPQGPGLVC
jgi:hypothetical protein